MDTDTGSRLADFFISRTGADSIIAQTIGAILEGAGYRVVLQDFDFKNRNFIQMMDAALASGARVIAVLSQDYLSSDHCAAEWYHPLVDDPLNKQARLILLRVKECVPQGLLKGIAFCDLAPLREAPDLLEQMVLAAVDPVRRAALPQNLAVHWKKPGTVIDESNIRRTPGFTGRADAIESLHRALWLRSAAALVQPAAVHGLGGVGKSTIARQYAWAASQVPDVYSGVWWLDAETAPATGDWPGVVTGLVRLGNVFIRGLADVADQAAAARHALSFLSDAGFAKPWLLVYDNVDDKRVLDAWPPPHGAHVIVTSREAKWDADEMTPITIENWPRPDSIKYMREKSGRADLTDAEAGAIAETLGDLPLAITHAAAYLADNDAASAQDYLYDIAAQLAKVPEGAKRAAPRSVIATLAQNIAQAERRVPGSGAILSLVAYYAPDDIPFELLEQPIETYPEPLRAIAGGRARLIDALGALSQLSLVTVDRSQRTISVHRLVQAAARSVSSESEVDWAIAAIAAATSAFPQPDHANVEACGRLLPHVRALVPLADTVALPIFGWLLGTAGSYATERSALHETRALFNASRAVFETLARSHPDNVDFQRNLSVSYSRIGNVLVAQGKLREALEAYRSDLTIADRLARSDPSNAGWQQDLSVSHTKVGNVLVAQGRISDALNTFRDGLGIAERLAQADPGNTGWQRHLSVSYNNLGDVLVAQGRLADALMVFRDGLAIAKRLAKADPENAEWQRDLSVSYTKVGDVLVAQGERADALKTFRESLAIAERLTQTDPGNAGWQRDLWVSRSKIGEILVAQGDLSAALTEHVAARDIALRLTGLDVDNVSWQRDLSISYDLVGDVLVAQGQLPNALKAFRDSRAIAERLATSDPGNVGWQADLAASCGKLGGLYLRMGERDEARRLFTKGRAIVAPFAEESGHQTWLRYLKSFDAALAALDASED